MIKKIVLMLAAALAMCPAYGQTPDTTSTVVGRKLNFEAPIFGLSKRDLKPSWSVVFLDEVSLGLHYLPGAPAEIKSAGIFAELFPLAFRYRPWRDGNVFSAGLLIGTTMNGLRKGYAFADNGSIVPMPTTWKKDWSYYTSLEIGLQIGYVKEFGLCAHAHRQPVQPSGGTGNQPHSQHAGQPPVPARFQGGNLVQRHWLERRLPAGSLETQRPRPALPFSPSGDFAEVLNFPRK